MKIHFISSFDCVKETCALTLWGFGEQGADGNIFGRFSIPQATLCMTKNTKNQKK